MIVAGVVDRAGFDLPYASSPARFVHRERSFPMVMLVDDAQDVCDILQRMLVRKGFYVVCAHDTYEAERLLKDLRPSVIVLDDSMPGRSGLEWLRQLKSDPSQSKIPVLMFSASADITRAAQAKEIGANAWFVKRATDWNVLLGSVTDLHGLDHFAGGH
jgi:DNA-binding response OmpR family regulator